MVFLELGNQKVGIEEGELISYKVDDHEFIHQKGSPGWSSADTEMFPIIGPVDKADFLVQTPRGMAEQDQHGHFRQFPYDLLSKTSTVAVYSKTYNAGTEIRNSKYPSKSTREWLNWPYSFQVEKQFELGPKGLSITFTISGEEQMPFMLGYHPAFKLHTARPKIETKEKTITLSEVLAVGSRALQLANQEEVTLKDQKDITIKTEGFGHFMCWTEVPNMVCIEPITFYPYAVEQKDLHTGFEQLTETRKLKVWLLPKN